jgi:hypothetical protein
MSCLPNFVNGGFGGVLEGLWWADDMSDFTKGNKDAWRCTMMIMVPDWISSEVIASATASVQLKKAPPKLALLRSEVLIEGQCVQITHIGSYDEEAPALARLHAEY